MYIVLGIVFFAIFLLLVVKPKGNRKKLVAKNTNYSGVLKDVIIKDCGSSKIAVIKCVREVMELGLAEAKNLVDRGVIEAIPVETAEVLVSSFNEIGVSAEMVGYSDFSDLTFEDEK